jgi:hypothetical protein
MTPETKFPGLKPLEQMTCLELTQFIHFTYAISDANRLGAHQEARELREEMLSKLSASPFVSISLRS